MNAIATTTFKVKTSTGLTFTVEAANLMAAQNDTLKHISECKDGEYLEIMGEKRIHRTTKSSKAWHWDNPGYRFDSYDKEEGMRRGLTLFSNGGGYVN